MSTAFFLLLYALLRSVVSCFVCAMRGFYTVFFSYLRIIRSVPYDVVFMQICVCCLYQSHFSWLWRARARTRVNVVSIVYSPNWKWFGKACRAKKPPFTSTPRINWTAWSWKVGNYNCNWYGRRKKGKDAFRENSDDWEDWRLRRWTIEKMDDWKGKRLRRLTTEKMDEWEGWWLRRWTNEKIDYEEDGRMRR